MADRPAPLAPVQIATTRRIILGVLLLGMAGLLAELFLLGHYEDLQQQIPLALLAAGLAGVVVDLVVPRRWTGTLLQLIMVLFIAAGLLGMYFHYSGSRVFQLEMDPAMSGLDLVWHVLRAKSPPTLSPGTMVQMGILGLGYAYLRRSK
jgi:TRAP-type uncharacterized transport system fused permease subunit